MSWRNDLHRCVQQIRARHWPQRIRYARAVLVTKQSDNRIRLRCVPAHSLPSDPRGSLIGVYHPETPSRDLRRHIQDDLRAHMGWQPGRVA